MYQVCSQNKFREGMFCRFKKGKKNGKEDSLYHASWSDAV